MAKKPLSRHSKPTQAATQENQQQPTDQPGHTPGPWIASREDMDSFDGDGRFFAQIYAEPDPFDLSNDDTIAPAPIVVARLQEGNIRANARLIAAAPDLLAACEALMAARLSVFDGGVVDQYNAERAAEKLAEQAIAKATGKAVRQ